MTQYQLPFAVALISTMSPSEASTVLQPSQDVMTSGFFQGTDKVRGYSGDARATFRVSNDGAFGVGGAETIYLNFSPNDFTDFTAPVASAILTVTSKSGGFGGDAGADSPFLVSAHGVSADPLTSIIDNTNTGGTSDWLTFYNDSILAAYPASLTSVDRFGLVSFDVTPLINDWISGDNLFPTIALTGKNETGSADFLHGFANNTESPGSSFLTLTAIPEPSSVALGSLAIALGLTSRRRKSSN